MENIVSPSQPSINEKLWLAVIDSAIADWVRGPAGYKRKAEHFLFEDVEDFPFVCRSAGLNPETVRETLWTIRAQSECSSAKNVA